MGFLVPAFLAGLAAIVVPIVLHLRHRDKDTPHRFPSLMFLERLPIRTAQRRRITDWPLLLLRALAIVLLVLAFARPLFVAARRDRARRSATRTVVVLLDRSMSMGHTRRLAARRVDAARGAIAGLGADRSRRRWCCSTTRPRSRSRSHDKNLALAALANAKPGTRGHALRRRRCARRARSRPTRAPAPRRSTSCSSPTCSAADAPGSPASRSPPTMRVRTVALVAGDGSARQRERRRDGGAPDRRRGPRAARRHGARDVARHGPGAAR